MEYETGLKELADALQTGSVPQLILFHGDDPYLLIHARRKVCSMLCDAMSKYRPEVQKIDDARPDPADIRRRILTQSLFSQSRILEWKTHTLGNVSKMFLDELKKFFKSRELSDIKFCLLIDHRGELTATHGLVKLAKTNGFCFEFKKVSPYVIGNPSRDPMIPWLSSRLDQCGKKMSMDLLKKFRITLPNDSWVLINELDKLTAYVGDRKEITSRDLVEVLSSNPEEQIFAITESIAERKVQVSLLAFRHLLMLSHPVTLVLHALYRQMIGMLQMKALITEGIIEDGGSGIYYGVFRKRFLNALTAFGKRSGWTDKSWITNSHPYVIYRLYQQHRFFTVAELVRFLVDLADIDHHLKTSSTSGEELLEHWIREACREGDVRRRSR